MTGLVFFIASTALGAASVVILAARTATWPGPRVAAKEAAVTSGSLAAYVVVCVWLGYGIAPQLLGFLAGAAVLYFGRAWVPALATYSGRP